MANLSKTKKLKKLNKINILFEFAFFDKIILA